MVRVLTLFLATTSVWIVLAAPVGAQTHEMSKEELRSRIRAGWAAQTIGVTFGGPTEFQYNGTWIQDYDPLTWYNGFLADMYDDWPGLYDDIYMDLTFVEVIEEEGLDATAEQFAKAYAYAEYPLWHANQMARYNIRNGIMPPESGHWRNNPGADDIDFQIESDFAGLMTPGLPLVTAAIADTVGHIMNSGDGWYGGVYVSTMYALAFTHDDVETVVTEALRAIPEESRFHRTIADVIRWHDEYPNDWRRNWFEIQKKWSEDVGCPYGVFQAFNIDASLNAAYVVLGLLYGDGDFGKTLSIATRAGQDSDCNPATAGGILATMRGFDWIPDYWKQGLAEVEDRDFKYTDISLDDVYDLSYRHALEVIARNGGDTSGTSVRYAPQEPEPVALEQNFPGHHPVDEIELEERLEEEVTFDFEGIGFTIAGGAESQNDEDHVLKVAVYIDGELDHRTTLPTSFTARKFVPFWKYELEDGPHTVRLVVENPEVPAHADLEYVIVYGSEPTTYEY